MTGKPWLGKIRRSQVITTYGIGAIVDLEPGSFVPLGIEEWEKQTRLARKSSIIIYESRLQAQLDVEEFRMAPILEEIRNQPKLVNPEYSVPVIRFPRWLECPKCHRLGKENDPFELDADERQLRCTACNQKVNPVRFVIACANGHLDDFPWVWWAHRSRDGVACNNPILELRSQGRSAALADLMVKCRSCDAPPRSMGDAFSRAALAQRNCWGKRPWLLDDEPCDRELRTLQRGASNVHFAAVVSALSIPPVSEPVQQFIDEHWSVYRIMPEENLDTVLQGSADQLGIPVQLLVSACRRRKALERGEAEEEGNADLRLLEYAALSGTTEEMPAIGGHVAQFQNTVSDPPPEIDQWFDAVGAVTRLREVRAMVGFSRIEPQPVSLRNVRQLLDDGRIAPIAKHRPKWYPAAEIRGEGIFLKFREDKINSWIASSPDIAERANQIDRWLKQVAEDRGYDPEYDITPRLLLIHSFAHALIRRLSIKCGYSSAALRERLYIKEADDDGPAMQGVLIYTGTPDSEGSLGGLVRQADPERLGPLVVGAIREASWCGSDPVCLETEPDVAGERIGGAACHCCLLVPETACEKFNRELDRSMLVGHAEGKWDGYFDGIGGDSEGVDNGELVPEVAKDCPGSERLIYEKLGRELPDDWIVLHSLELTTHPHKMWGETDIVVISTKGVFVIEVKGGSVSCRDGEWTIRTLSGREVYTSTESPWGQAATAASGIRTKLYADERFRGCLVGYGVALPFETFTASSEEILQEVLWDKKNRNENLGMYIGRIARYWHEQHSNRRDYRPRELSRQDVIDIRNLLRPDVESHLSLGSYLNSLEADLLELTAKQARAYKGMSGNQKTMIRGMAGTGKTVLAVNKAIELAKKDEKSVLFLCFNKLLAAHVATNIPPELAQRIRVTHLHSFYYEVIEAAQKLELLECATDESDLFATVMPEAFYEAALTTELDPYEVLVVDEAQDLMTPANLDALDIVVQGGLSYGSWHLFMDPMQDIYGELSDSAQSRLLEVGFASYDLTANCRNTKPVAIETSIVAGFECAIEDAIDGPQCVKIFYSDARALKAKLDSEVGRLLNQDVPLKNIVVLSSRKLENSSVKDIGDIAGHSLADLSDSVPNDEQLAFSTIHAFKGLERQCVVAIDIENLDHEERALLHYAGMSRALTLLITCMHEDTEPEYERHLRDFGARLVG